MSHGAGAPQVQARAAAVRDFDALLTVARRRGRTAAELLQECIVVADAMLDAATASARLPLIAEAVDRAARVARAVLSVSGAEPPELTPDYVQKEINRLTKEINRRGGKS